VINKNKMKNYSAGYFLYPTLTLLYFHRNLDVGTLLLVNGG